MITTPPPDEVRDLESRIRSALQSEPRLGPSFSLAEIRLEAEGIVLLIGETLDVASKKIALERVAALPGVSGVADHLTVIPATPMGDQEILDHVRNGLIGETSFHAHEIRERAGRETELARGAPAGAQGSIDIEVADGTVTLNGSVPSLASKRLAGVIAWWVPGVRNVINGISVEPPEEDGPDRIAEAVRIVLEKDPLVDAGQIKVGVRKKVVRLTGLVPDETQRDAAERDAWMVFGVDTVINKIDVRP